MFVPNATAAPALRPPGVGSGLLGVASQLEVSADGQLLIDGQPTGIAGSEHWISGLQWLPEGWRVSGAAKVDPAGTMTIPATSGSYEIATLQGMRPFGVFAVDKASTVDQERDRWGRARRSLAAEQSFQIAAELELGTLARTDGDNPSHYLTDGDMTVLHDGDTLPLAEALICIDGTVTRRLRNRQGMIHMTPDHLSAAQQLLWPRWNGSTAYSPNGHVLAVDAGYTGQAVDGSSSIYGTDLIRVILGPVRTTPAVDGDMASAELDRDTNDLVVRAMRPVAYQWDHGCHVSVVTDVTPCLDTLEGS